VLLSFVAEGLALLTGRIPYISGVAVLASASYLIEAADKWREERRPAPGPDLATSFALPPATSISLSAGGTRRLAPLQQPGRAWDAAEQSADIGDSPVEVVDRGAELADDRDELLQRA
jgi:hypothetical protein